MNDSIADKPAKRKRGRPPSAPAEKRHKTAPRPDDSDCDQLVTSDNSAPTKLLLRYHEAHTAYERTNQLTYQLMRRLAAQTSLLQQQSQQEPVLHQVIDIARKLMMTELELVVWALHLTRAQLTEAMSLGSALLVSAFYIKLTLGAEIAALQAYLEKHTGDFGKHLDIWEQLNPKGTVKFSLQEINAKWKELKRPISEEDVPTINYNYYVDDILQAGVTPVDQFTSGDACPNWLHTPLRTPKPAPPPVSSEPSLAKECEDFPYASFQWFENVPSSPGMLFFSFPSPLPSALLQPMEEQLFDPQTRFQTH